MANTQIFQPGQILYVIDVYQAQNCNIVSPKEAISSLKILITESMLKLIILLGFTIIMI